MQDRITSFVTRNSSIDPERFSKLMMKTGEMATDVGTVLDGEKAVKEGLIDQLGGLSDAMDCLYGMISSRPQKDASEGKETPGQKTVSVSPHNANGKQKASGKNSSKNIEKKGEKKG